MTTGATEAIEALLSELGERSGPLEHVLADWDGPDVQESLASIERGGPRVFFPGGDGGARYVLGSTGDPTWVEGLSPRRGDDEDLMFSLYHRPGFFAYARLSGEPADEPTRMKLIVGVVRMRT